MKRQMIACILACQLLACAISGCGYYKETAATESPEQPLDLTEQYYDSSGQVAYEKPTATVHILIDQSGYECTDAKRAVFVGDGLADTFSVCDKETKETVYTGHIVKKGFDPARHDYIWEGDFSDVNTPGTYYISTQKLGQSYPFEIQDDLYLERLEILGRQLSGYDFSKQTAFDTDCCIAVSNLLLAFELYGEKEDASAYFKNIASGIGKWQQLDDLSQADRQQLSGLLAQYAGTCKEFDEEGARAALSQAKQLFVPAETEGAPETYFAATQLYKASGDRQYRTIVERILEQSGQTVSGNDISGKALYTLGDIAYLTTGYEVNQKLCEQMMDRLLSKAEALSSQAGTHIYRITAGETGDDLYENMLILAIVDYAIVSHEYLSLLKEDIHYLYGKGLLTDISEHTVSEQTYIYFIMMHIAQRKENIT